MDKEEKMRRLAAYLREKMRSLGLSERGLARQLKLNPASLQTYLDESVYPSEETRRKMARNLGLDYSEFQHLIEGAALPDRRPVEEICAEIRAMPDEDFVVVFNTVCDRVKAALEPQED